MMKSSSEDAADAAALDSSRKSHTSTGTNKSDKGGRSKSSRSFLARAARSFIRTGGTKDASVENLRGTRGADFEGPGRVTRGVEGIGCLCMGRGDAHQDRYFVIKGPFCFVFANVDSPSPKYAIGLQYMTAKIKCDGGSGSGDNSKKHVTVWLENNLGDVEYEFVFDGYEHAQNFSQTVESQAATAQAEQVRKRLGHENLMVKHASVVFAEKIAHEKEQDQPDAPVSSTEIMANLPQVAM